MKERPSITPPHERVAFLKHPILTGRLRWTDKRIASFMTRENHAKRILSLSHASEFAKKEARLNSRISEVRLFDLRKHREDLLRKAQSRR